MLKVQGTLHYNTFNVLNIFFLKIIQIMKPKNRCEMGQDGVKRFLNMIITLKIKSPVLGGTWRNEELESNPLYSLISPGL